MSEEKIKIAMMSAVSKALDYKKKNPEANVDEILQFLMKELKIKGKEKIGAMAAASKAIEYKEKEPDINDKQIMQKIMNESEEILMTMEL